MTYRPWRPKRSGMSEIGAPSCARKRWLRRPRAKCACARCSARSAAAPSGWCSTGACRKANSSACARPSWPAAFRFRSNTATRRSARSRADEPRGRTVFVLHPASERVLLVPAQRRRAVPENVPPAARGARSQYGDRAQRGLGRRARAGGPHRRGRRRRGRASGRAIVRADSRHATSPWSTSRPARAATWRKRSGSALHARNAAPGDCDLVVPRQRQCGRACHGAAACRRGGNGR